MVMCASGHVYCAGHDTTISLQTRRRCGSIGPEQMCLPVCDLSRADADSSTQLQGSDWNGQVKIGNGQFVGVNYLQSVTPNLALGGEAFWLGQQRKSGAGFAARYADKEHVATAQVATTGLVSLAYLRRLSEKVC